MKAVRLSALRTGRLYPAENISYTHFCYRLSRPEGHSTAGRIMSTSSGIEPTNFRFVAQCLDQLRHRALLYKLDISICRTVRLMTGKEKSKY